MSELTINGRKCLLYECGDQPQVLLIQPVGEHENATLDAEIEAAPPITEMRPPRAADKTRLAVEELAIDAIALVNNDAFPFP